jgi:hypothetical protein
VSVGIATHSDGLVHSKLKLREAYSRGISAAECFGVNDCDPTPDTPDLRRRDKGIGPSRGKELEVHADELRDVPMRKLACKGTLRCHFEKGCHSSAMQGGKEGVADHVFHWRQNKGVTALRNRGA